MSEQTNQEVAVIPERGIDMQALIAQAIQQNIPIETMERILTMRRELKAEWSKEQFIAAMAKFQSECPVIEKRTPVYEKGSRTVRYYYAPIDDIVDQVKPHLAINGLSYTFDEIKDEQFTEVLCIVTHVNGHSQITKFKIPIGTEQFMSDVQKYGARMTFGKRYAFCNAFGIMTGEGDTDARDDEGQKQPPKAITGGVVRNTPQRAQSSSQAQSGAPSEATAPSKAQLGLIDKLVDEKGATLAQITALGFPDRDNLTKNKATILIDVLKTLPNKSAAPATAKHDYEEAGFFEEMDQGKK